MKTGGETVLNMWGEGLLLKISGEVVVMDMREGGLPKMKAGWEIQMS